MWESLGGCCLLGGRGKFHVEDVVFVEFAFEPVSEVAYGYQMDFGFLEVEAVFRVYLVGAVCNDNYEVIYILFHL